MNIREVSDMELMHKWWKQLLALVAFVVAFVVLQQQQIHADEKLDKHDKLIESLVDKQHATINALGINNVRLEQITKEFERKERSEKALNALMREILIELKR